LINNKNFLKQIKSILDSLQLKVLNRCMNNFTLNSNNIFLIHPW